MALIVYLDEAGDHTLELVDKSFPLFVLVMLICEKDVYAQKIVPAVCQLKMDFFGHEAVILHSRDIRKAQGDFGFLTSQERKKEFYDRIDKMMLELEYKIIATVIRKQEHKEKYVWASSPYDLALKFALERLLPFLEDVHQNEVQLIAESRGKREDNELLLSFWKVVNDGTEFINAERFRKIHFRLDFKPKAMNLVGTQLADLAAYPIARYILDPKKENVAYRIVQKKFYSGRGRVYGLKVFP